MSEPAVRAGLPLHARCIRCLLYTSLDRTWSVSPEAFSEQMTYLAREGWHSVSPAELYAYLQEGAPLPPKAIIISMDDGYREVYDVAPVSYTHLDVYKRQLYPRECEPLYCHGEAF